MCWLLEPDKNNLREESISAEKLVDLILIWVFLESAIIREFSSLKHFSIGSRIEPAVWWVWIQFHFSCLSFIKLASETLRQAEGVEKEVCCYLASDWWVGLCFHVSVCDSVVSYVGEKENSHIFGSLHSPSLTQTSSSSMKCHHFEDSMSLFEEIQ